MQVATTAPTAKAHRPDQGLYLCVAVVLGVLTYIAFADRLSASILSSTPFDYYTLQTEAFLNGRLAVTPRRPSPDLVVYEGESYIYWGPSAVLFILPFVLAGHGLQHDVAYTLVAGCANVAVFALVAREAASYCLIRLKAVSAMAFVLLFALASPNFYLSLQGRIWHTSQVVSTLYFLMFLWFFFRQLNRPTAGGFAAGMLFFNLAWVARMTLAAAAPLAAMLILSVWRRNRALALRCAAIAVATLGVSVLAWGAFNHARFGRFTETGYSHMQHARRFVPAARAGTLWHVRHIPRNSYYYFVNLPIDRTSRAFTIDLEGNSVFAFYPWTLLVAALPLAWPAVGRGRRLLMAGVVTVGGLQVLALLTFFATGWTQLGARYFLDAVPLLLVSLLPVVARLRPMVLVALLGAGMAMNVAGMSQFYGFR
jgi:hypothetical protein